MLKGSAFRALVAGWLAGDTELLPLSEATDMAYVGDRKKEKIPPNLKLQFRPKVIIFLIVLTSL